MAHHSAAKPDLDVLIVGAGISGVSAAYHLQKRCPDKSYAILERRDAVGGTWDLFRYPGIRSDSDMYTLGFRFKPWEKQKAIADGHSIKKYVEETVDEENIRKNIRFGRKVIDARWSSQDALWTVEALNEATGETERTTARFIAMCAGYYNYDAGYTPEFEGVDSFEGQLIHPQQWPEDLDYAGKRVVVIGSGATAVTIVPVMAETAGHVTMLQRSPTYMISRSAEDGFALTLRKFLPAKLAYGIVRWRNVILQQFFFKMARNKPVKVKEKLLKAVRAKLPKDYDVETHFTPRYNPWEERLCLVPDNDMFHAISSGKASVATDHIERFSPEGLKLKSGRTLAADIVVTATG
ncbi:MAG: NAD(P)/FAD-dependent oxidoreductase, partial [Pseudomonadota bacterium]